jgi:acetyltransferase-like isoleucine patch superfamily enzyme
MTSLREALKILARGLAGVLMVPALCSYYLRSPILGKDRALEGSSQALALIPGLGGQYLRRAFLSRVLAYCAPSAVVECGTLFSAAGARLDEGVYVGPYCHLGLVHLEREVLLGPAVQIPSGGRTHGIDDTGRPIRDQQGALEMVTVGAGSWIGAAAVVMADVGPGTVVGAGAVVTRPLPSGVVAGGVPARVIRQRTGDAHTT